MVKVAQRRWHFGKDILRWSRIGENLGRLRKAVQCKVQTNSAIGIAYGAGPTVHKDFTTLWRAFYYGCVKHKNQVKGCGEGAPRTTGKKRKNLLLHRPVQ